MLEVDGLIVRYGSTPALHGISLDVREGEAVALIGPNGAGKTTTLAAIAGLVRQSAGSILFDGLSLAGESTEGIVRRGISLVPEGRHIFATLTVAENLGLGATPRTNKREIDDDLERVLQLFPVLRTYHRSPAGKLSGGEQQQLAIARALLARPRLLMLDEPSLGLAPRVIDLVFETLERLRAEAVTLLLVEQNVERAVQFADRTYVLRSGRMRLSGTRDELIADGDLAATYLGR